MVDIVEKFMELFHGLDRAYGTYGLARTKKVQRVGEKIVGKPSTKQEPVTDILWKNHLEGRMGIGIVPILDNSTCYFGAIDIDVYEGLDILQIIVDIDKRDLPLVPIRTKSGGVHLYTFVSEPVPASLMKDKLTQFSSLLGFGGSEIFPKQTEILSDRGDIGQWINMPYFNAENTDRYAYNRAAQKMEVLDFIKYAYKKRMTAKEFAAFTVQVTDDASDGPPCLQYLLTQGFSTGSRNDGLFFVAVYLKKSHPDNWKLQLDEYNMRYFNPMLSSSEVQGVIKSLEHKDYAYTCDKNPMKSHCNKSICFTRKYGVGQGFGTLQLTGLTKHDSMPPIWFVDVEDGGRLELSTEDLQSQQRFQRRCMESLNTMPPILKQPAWQGMIQELLESAVIIEAPADASPKGIFFEYLERFCTSRAQAQSVDELLLGKPWTEDNFHYFRVVDFMSYLDRHRFFDFKVHQVSAMLKDYGGEHKFFRIKGKGVNVWKIPMFEVQTEGFNTPDYGDDVM